MTSRASIALVAAASFLGACCSAAAGVRTAAPPGPVPVTSNLPAGSPPPAPQVAAVPSPAAPDEIPGSPACSAAYRCCLAFIETVAPGTPETRAACEQIRGAAGTPGGEAACTQMSAAWRQSLESMGRPTPDACR